MKNELYLPSFNTKIEINYLLIKLFSLLLIILIVCLNNIIYNKEKNIIKKKINEENSLSKNIININKNNNILIPYIKQQNDFCHNKNKYYNKIIEDQIILKKVKFEDYSYEIYVYKNPNFLTNSLRKEFSFEESETINILKALQYYSIKNNIKNNKNIFMLDIGGNVGWYPSFLGRFGYSILSFEPFETNYYVLMKNYCLINQKSNVVIITKGINNEEKRCDYFMHVNNTGNGMIICDKNIINNKLLNHKFKKLKNVSLTKLSNFIPYLSDKNLALIKIDIEGAEGKAIESGIDLITKYHVPFIVIEFTPILLKEHGTNPYKLIKLFIDNDYYISLKGFLFKSYISIGELMSQTKHQRDCYFIYKHFID